MGSGYTLKVVTHTYQISAAASLIFCAVTGNPFLSRVRAKSSTFSVVFFLLALIPLKAAITGTFSKSH